MRLKKRVFQYGIFLIAAASCVFVCGGHYSSVLAENNTIVESMSETYAQKIASIESGKTLIDSRALLNDNLFKQLAREGSRNLDAVIDFLSADGHSQQQRSIAILSMHELNAPDYALFLKKLLGLYKKQLATKEEIGLAVVPGYAFSTVLIENYRLHEVWVALKEIDGQPDIRPSTKMAIENITSGKSLDDMMKFKRDCCVPRN